MAKQSTGKADASASEAKDDLSTPKGIFNRLITIAKKSSAPEEDPSIKEIAKTQPKLLTAVAPLLCDALRKVKGDGDSPYEALTSALRGLVRLKLPFDVATAQPMFQYILDKREPNTWTDPLLLLVGVAERLLRDEDLDRLPKPIEQSLAKIREALAGGHIQRNERHAIERIDTLLGQASEMPVKPGDPIADAIIADVKGLDASDRSAWIAFLKHCAGASGSKPAKSWLKGLDAVLKPVADSLAGKLSRWFPLLASSRENGKPARINPSNYELLTGLTRSAAVIVERGNQDASLAAALQSVAVAAYTKVPGLGRRCPKVGDAAVAALSLYPVDVAAARLTAIQRAAKDPMTTDTLNAALDALATKAGIPRDQLEELTIPTFGLSPAGTREVQFGPVTAVIDISSGSAEITYRNDKGKTIASMPAAVKRDHDDAIKSLKQDVKDLDKLLASQRDRLDVLISQQRTWPLAEFRRMYLDHPLVSRVARALIWTVDDNPAIFRDDRFEDAAGKVIKTTAKSTVAPWHPIQSPADLVLAWRKRLEALEITQPFKQAHREIYLLTDAERTTATYSNRFAAHIIRQAQFRALAAGRGWTAPYLGGWDSGGAMPGRDLPGHDLRVEFWIEEAPIEQTEDDRLPGGGVMYLTTDQVRFERPGQPDRHNHPIPLDQIPPLVLSECLRDVDLFVSVCSVANDPNWQDATVRTAAQRDYWQKVSFGELSQSAQTRRAVLESLLPRLSKLKDRWKLTDRFLIIRGDLRTYKIHLGSSNILMEPDDQYLCIVPGRSSGKPATSGVFLPFEGDDRMSVILSKAFMLADDKAITDVTITRQLSR